MVRGVVLALALEFLFKQPGQQNGNHANVRAIQDYMGDCQNYGPFLGPYYNTGPNTGPNLGDPKWDHNFDNPPYRGM